ncbi:MAG: hypothetical protein MSH60_05095 [Ruminococcus sp.]|nr:hypothetical protein [Ruminococcus sp.]
MLFNTIIRCFWRVCEYPFAAYRRCEKFVRRERLTLFHEAPHTESVFFAFVIVVNLMLYCFVCVRCFLAVEFVRFSGTSFLTVSFGDFASAEATGALPLDPATFEKVDETFIFLLLKSRRDFSRRLIAYALFIYFISA